MSDKWKDSPRRFPNKVETRSHYDDEPFDDIVDSKLRADAEKIFKGWFGKDNMHMNQLRITPNEMLEVIEYALRRERERTQERIFELIEQAGLKAPDPLAEKLERLGRKYGEDVILQLDGETGEWCATVTKNKYEDVDSASGPTPEQAVDAALGEEEK